MKLILKIAIMVVAIPMLAFSAILLNPTDALALNCSKGTMLDGNECVRGVDMPACLFGSGCAFNTVINTMLFLLGAASVIMLVYGGIRYTLSGGSSTSVTAAKNTILYAIIGLVVALLAFAISNFVIASLK